MRNAFNARDGIRVPYGVVFETAPKLDVVREAFVDYELVEQGATGFKIKLTGVGSGASLTWTATGIPASKTDPRSTWQEFGLGQKIFSVTTLLAVIGLIADLIGIVDFLRR